MRRLARIEKINDICKIQNADLICSYGIRGWRVVDQIGKYEVGDLVVYFEIDSFIPNNIAPFLSKGREPREFNGVFGERLRTIQLRNQVSQGLIMPIDIVPEEYRVLDTDVTEILGIQKWEAPVSASLGGIVRGNMPGWCKKTDQERCQNLVDEIRAAYDNDVEFEVTIKLDGSSMTVGHNDGDKIVCSRNLSLILDQTGNTFVDVAKSSGILKDIAKLGNICISGELMGPGIQKNREKLSKHEFYVFDMLYVDTYSMVPAETRRALAADLGLRHVPVLHHRITLRELELDSIDKILKFAEGKSLNAEVREGVVFKSIDGTFSFKAISNKFLLKNNE